MYMKKILALALALMLALLQIGAVAENDTAKSTSVYESYTINGDMLDALVSQMLTNEKDLELVHYVRDLINNLTFGVIFDDQAAYIEAALNSKVIATVQAAPTEDGGYIAISDLFPSYAISVSPELIQAISSFDVEALKAQAEAVANAVLPHVQEYITAVLDKHGEAEVGEYAIDDQTFTVKVPINITSKEFALLTVNMVKAIVAEPALADMIAMIPDFDAAKIDELAAEIEKQEKTPDMELSLYGLVNQETGDVDMKYVTCALVDETSVFAMSGGDLTSQVALHFLTGPATYESLAAIKEAAQNGAPDAIAVDLFVAAADDTVAMELDLFTQMFAALTMQGYMNEQQGALKEALYLGTTSAPLFTQDTVMVKNATELPALNVGERTVIPVEALIAEMQNQEENAERPLITALMEDVQNNGLTVVLTAATEAMPDTVTPLITAVTQRIMEQMQGLQGLFGQDQAEEEQPQETQPEAQEEAEPELSEEELEQLLQELFGNLSEGQDGEGAADGETPAGTPEQGEDMFSEEDLEQLFNMLFEGLTDGAADGQ